MALVSKNVNALGVLVDEVCEANGWSRRDLARRAEERGHELSHQRLSQMCTADPLAGIQADKIFAIAAALGVSSARVAIAAVEAMGVRISDTSITPAEAIARDQTLSEDTRHALLAILQAPRRGVRGA
jgi:transcriptional regulator with XRE-family HTH domain